MCLFIETFLFLIVILGRMFLFWGSFFFIESRFGFICEDVSEGIATGDF